MTDDVPHGDDFRPTPKEMPGQPPRKAKEPLLSRRDFIKRSVQLAVVGALIPGAAAEEVEFGITLQQYWIGLIGLAGMIFIMVAGFVYLKFVNPHNTDPKDR